MLKGIYFSLCMLLFCLLGFSTNQEVLYIESSLAEEKDKKVDMLYFGATWCTPCKITKRNMKDEKVKKELERFDDSYYDVDIDKKEKEKYKIRYVPAIIFVKEGKEIARYTGGQSKEQLLKILKKY